MPAGLPHEVAASSLGLIAALAVLLAWLANPYLALLLVPVAHVWLLDARRAGPLAWPLALGAIALSLLPMAAAVLHVTGRLDLGAGAPWHLTLMVGDAARSASWPMLSLCLLGGSLVGAGGAGRAPLDADDLDASTISPRGSADDLMDEDRRAGVPRPPTTGPSHDSQRRQSDPTKATARGRRVPRGRGCRRAARCCSSCSWPASAAGRSSRIPRDGTPGRLLARAPATPNRTHRTEADRSRPARARRRPQSRSTTPCPSSTAPIWVSAEPPAATSALARSRALGRQRDQELVVLSSPSGKIVGVDSRGSRHLAYARLQRQGFQLDRKPGRRSPPQADSASPPSPSLRSIIALAPVAGERAAGGDSRTRLQLAPAQAVGDLCPDDVRQLGTIQDQEPRRRAPELAGDEQQLARGGPGTPHQLLGGVGVADHRDRDPKHRRARHVAPEHGDVVLGGDLGEALAELEATRLVRSSGTPSCT